MRRLMLGCVALVTLLTGTMVASAERVPYAPQCVNDSTNLLNNYGQLPHSPLSGDPNVGLPANGGYYYLSVVACSSTVTVDVYTQWYWGFQFMLGSDLPNSNVYAKFHVDDNAPSIHYVFTQAVVGQTYSVRIRNDGTVIFKDHSHISS